ncbi:HAD superfamily hydrolase (TIGR01509 family) [Caldicoprobacter guelmensis]|uniref:HAD-IA family hydrolase n=1 Tax=Caldicoprobacter guelmensis TaxID=1170224 RepID=UPI00195915ED|nr:HAD-IA family hydrolase [Caldicoprobacter guelmensis]MBM7583231.1 HAD superfamily hydrolase (TIGR01509 family) [Caldicoprobacter guelmensis]
MSNLMGTQNKLKALIFDCDGVIAETERDGHRVAFNRAFKEAGLDVEWNIEEYGELVKIAGGKERMKAYFQRHPDIYPPERFNDEFINKLHKRKTEIFMDMSAKGELPIRPGIRRIIDEAHERGIILAVCSTSNEKSVVSLLQAVLGSQRLNWFNGIFAGDIVKAKKPAPDIYNLVKERFNLKGSECFVVEDSRNGLLAAKAAGMHCLITISFYSQHEDFSEADLVVSSLGEPDLPVKVIKGHPNIDVSSTKYINIDTLEKML